MLDILEMLGRMFMGVLRLLSFIEAIIDTGFGLLWLFSPAYRAEVRAADDRTKLRVYVGVFLSFLILLGAVVLLGFGVKVLMAG